MLICWYRILVSPKRRNRCRATFYEIKKRSHRTTGCDNGYLLYLAGGGDNGSTNAEHLSSSDSTSTVSMSMSNPNGNASTDGVLTVTVQNEPKSKQPSTTEIKSSMKKRSSGSVTSTTSYPNSNFTNK